MSLLRRPPSRLLVGLIALAGLGFACGPPEQTPSPSGVTPPPAAGPGQQVLAISTVPRLKPTPTAQDFVDALNLVRSAGVRGSFESATWSDLSTVAGQSKLTDAVAGAARRGDTVLVNIKVLDTTVRSTPVDLNGSTFDSQLLLERFHALIDALKPGLAGKVRYLSIGNEVDVYLGLNPGGWDAYQRFYADAVDYVHQHLPGVSVGVTATFDGARGGGADRLVRLNQLSDVVILTYYPLGPAFVPRTPTTARTDLGQMLAIAGGKPLVLQEVGYPSDTRLASSEQAQAAFAAEVLAAWHEAGGARAPFLNWFALGDFTAELCDQLNAYYTAARDDHFTAFLCSLGLRRVDGVPKAAWQVILDRPRE